MGNNPVISLESLQDAESLQYEQGEGRIPNIFLRDPTRLGKKNQTPKPQTPQN